MCKTKEMTVLSLKNLTDIAGATFKEYGDYVQLGTLLSNGCLVLMALFSVYIGCVRSANRLKFQKSWQLFPITKQLAAPKKVAKRGLRRKSKEKVVYLYKSKKHVTMTRSVAAMFPLVASATLFNLYILFQIFSEEYINFILTGFFIVLGVLALYHLVSPVISSLVPAAIPNTDFHLRLFLGKGFDAEKLSDYEFTIYDMFCFACCTLVGVWYLFKKHWIFNNLFGISFAISGIERLQLDNVVTGCILLCGLLVYDIFWVFGTNVMVTVAELFEAPIILVFPQDLLEQGLRANNFSMLGLGDIVTPGIFIAFLLQFDNSLKRNTKLYFYASLAAYFIGLLATIFVMHKCEHAQPALLYLVPACLGTPLVIALLKGDISTLFKYDHPNDKNESKYA